MAVRRFPQASVPGGPKCSAHRSLRSLLTPLSIGSAFSPALPLAWYLQFNPHTSEARPKTPIPRQTRTSSLFFVRVRFISVRILEPI